MLSPNCTKSSSEQKEIAPWQLESGCRFAGKSFPAVKALTYSAQKYLSSLVQLACLHASSEKLCQRHSHDSIYTRYSASSRWKHLVICYIRPVRQHRDFQSNATSLRSSSLHNIRDGIHLHQHG